MKLDVTVLRYLDAENFRCLSAIEQGMRNHELVPTPLIVSIAKLKHGGTKKAIGVLHKHKLVWHDSKNYDGYKLTYAGYDYLALKALTNRGAIIGVANKIGVGKESDIYIAINSNEEEMVLKLHRLGRISFRNIKEKRDYLQHRKNASWMYLSRLAALKEFAFMKALHNHGFPVPTPIDWNRHCILMSRVPGYLMATVKHLKNPGKVYSDLMNLIVRLAQYGLIHGDFNEFNIMINDNEEITLIDFPQMVSTSHINAQMYFERDVDCIRNYFLKKYGYESTAYPVFHVDTEKEYSLDVEVAASGFTKQHQKNFESLVSEQGEDEDESDEQDDHDDDVNDKEDVDDEEDDNEEVDEMEGHGIQETKAEKDEVELDENEEAEKDEEDDLSDEDADNDESTEVVKNEGSDKKEQEEGALETPHDQRHIKQRVKRNMSKKNANGKLKRNNSKQKSKKSRDVIY